MKSVAVDPKIFPYGTKFKIPGFSNTLIAQDTGSWVKSRKAAIRRAQLHRLGQRFSNAPVLDIAVGSRQEYEVLKKTFPEFIEVEIIN